MKKMIVAVIAIVVLAALLYFGWARHTRKVSPLVGKPVPAFTLPLLQDQTRKFSPADMKGKVWMLNVWGSWCGKCIAEIPVLKELSRQNIVPVYGVDYKDKPESGQEWLMRHGNPYSLIVLDRDGRLEADFSIKGVPVTYIVDKQGIIQFGLEGELTDEIVKDKIIPLVFELEKK